MLRRLVLLVTLAGVTCLGFGSALVMAGSKAGASKAGLRVVLGHNAARRTACSSGSIQDEINAAAPGDTITVCDGTYTEQVTIPAGKDGLKLVAQSKNAVIKAPSPVAGGQQGAIVKVEALNVTITGFTIRGPGSGPPGSIGYGVEVVTGGSAMVDSNHILDIRDEPLSGAQNGWAIGANGGSVTATSNVIQGFQKIAIKVTGTGSVNTITDNSIVGDGPTSVNGQNGIFISGGARATVSGNDISKAFYTGTNASAGGIVATGSGAVSIENNTLSGKPDQRLGPGHSSGREGQR
jgi:nitrous oxidase accessory protein NosD